ncbi:carbamoyltransferase C-terminal domain-containing protein [Thalassospira profundimaris]|uniref:Carbamoyltransferase n=1 Tax=Thalassospira profundimaris TaxID=502049 RepID=A0A367WHT6_9PROT|nr:carbamoyltransferase C-terminal domain-containing protein [Thalassospira profundimaris]RCK40977.1 hypothetical protein TH30_22420 [Thalassospira profundimaris]
MIILGLHFGHDASITVMKDEDVLICYEIERHKKKKHVIGIEYSDVVACLADVNIQIEDIDYATVTSTQLVEYIFPEPEKLNIKLQHHSGHKGIPCALVDQLGITPEKFAETGLQGWLPLILRERSDHVYNLMLPDSLKKTLLETEHTLPSFEKFIEVPLWNERKSLKDISNTDFSSMMNDAIRHGFHYPVTLLLNGREIPSFVFAHHYAHIAYAFYQSPYEDAAILSNDGAGGGDQKYPCGMFAYGTGDKLYPYTPNTLAAGEMYDLASISINLDPGKLMGLSSYGQPRFYSPEFVGNWYDFNKRPSSDWVDHCLKEAKQLGYDLTYFGDREHILEPINVDFAASTQKLIEEILLFSVSAMYNSLQSSNVQTPNLCFSGGVALNCPANTRISNESPYSNVYVPPAIGDMGLSIGSAMALYYNILGKPRTLKKQTPKHAYLGGTAAERSIPRALDAYREKVTITECENVASDIANMIHRNQVIALFTGRSEVGPRALCHRSIIANPQHEENWKRVNEIKSRELWRPFAPIVLEGEEEKYFYGCPFPSYFMLFNAIIKTDNIPAITHVDRTSRIQSINADCGIIHDVLQQYKALGNPAVLMNTSFNGPKQPIIEEPEDAIEFLLTTEIDAVYLNNFKIEKLGR